jgi:hypothetical protein
MVCVNVQESSEGFPMYPEFNSYYAYIQREIRVARLERDIAISQFVDGVVSRIVGALRRLVGR